MNLSGIELADGQDLAGYRAGQEGAALWNEDDHGRLWLTGPDRTAFLQRMTTNDVRLQPGQGTVTILTSPTARILAVFTVLAHDDGMLLLAGPGAGPKAYNALRSQIFFADNVTLEGRGSVLSQLGLYGPQAAQVLSAAGTGGLADLPLFAWQTVTIADSPTTIQRNEGLGGPGFTLLVKADQGATLHRALLQAGATVLNRPAHQTLRVEAGVPAVGAELTEQVNPLEAGMRRFCNDHKGCYTGQEIIARQITYDKVTRHLVGLLLEQPTAAGATLMADQRSVGTITSVAHSPALGQPIALAVVRRPFHEPGTQLTVSDREPTMAAQVASLPLISLPA